MEVIAFAKLWWKAGAGVILGALLCFPLAQCHGENVADKRNAAALQAANDKARLAEQAARINADRLAEERKTARTTVLKELQNEAQNAPDGHKLDAVLDRLRKDASR